MASLKNIRIRLLHSGLELAREMNVPDQIFPEELHRINSRQPLVTGYLQRGDRRLFSFPADEVYSEDYRNNPYETTPANPYI